MVDKLPAPFIPQQYFDNDGNPLVGGKIYTYIADSSTDADTYVSGDPTNDSTNTNPIILDSAGRASIFFDTSVNYKIEAYTSADVLVWTKDYVFNPVSYDQVINALGYVPYDANNPDGFINELEGDATTGAAINGLAEITLVDVNPDPGIYGDQVTIPVFEVNSKGLMTNVAQVPIPLFDGSEPGLVDSDGADPSFFLAGDGTWQEVAAVEDQSLASNGYATFLGGLTIQWGFDSFSSGLNTVTFPIAFTTACYSVTFSIRRTGSNSGQAPTVQSLNTSNFTMRHADSSTGTYWIAVGQ